MLFAAPLVAMIIAATLLDEIVVVILGGSFIGLSCVLCFFTLKEMFTRHEPEDRDNFFYPQDEREHDW